VSTSRRAFVAFDSSRVQRTTTRWSTRSTSEESVRAFASVAALQ